MIEIKSSLEIESMRKASRVVAQVLLELKPRVKPGVSTAELDSFAEQRVRELGAVPAFLGYRGYPATLCVSINDEIVHGIPSPKRVIQDGDIVSLDMGAVREGFFGDAAVTVAAGRISGAARRLMDVTSKSLEMALSKVKAGARLGDVSHAVEKYALQNGMSVVKEFTGHGIGRHLHEEPSIPNFGKAGSGPVLKTGMTLAIEPMLCLGNAEVIVKNDGWTAVSADGSLAAHYEHTVAVTDEGCDILSAHG
ncbi:MAG: type I methionyl aminopeptidase [Elusimicrobia bacterium CG_4_10_14_0_2_um_filter_56_8]|nr:MAG: type I methionyl aminopeptidase [Elusimicrobia bacterium CG1_02_56_21]PJA11570.1 MAG: type I methionyl aminopeptidase [Elusimicrobia bacterium CG_4_10_14_0_2_um_filter_56_8]